MLRPVGGVSNISISSASTPAAVRAALSLILAPADRPAVEREVTEFLRIAAQRGIDLTKIVTVTEGGRMMWALLPMPTLGRTLQLLSPNHLFETSQLEAAGHLIESVCTDYAASGSQLAQVLVEPSSSALRVLYRQHRFTEMAELKYLQAIPRPGRVAPDLPAEFSFEPYTAASHELFAAAIRASYRDSLDCPALNGMRDIDDVIAGHRAAAGPAGESEFDPRLWRVLLQRRPESPRPVPCGVLLLCRIDTHEAMELVYLGLASEVRRRGIGTILLRQALADAANDNRRRLTLAVDSKNQPALELYYRHGFQRVGDKIAMMRDLRTSRQTAV